MRVCRAPAARRRRGKETEAWRDSRIVGLLAPDLPADEIPSSRSWGPLHSFGTRVSRVLSPLSSSRPRPLPALPAPRSSTHAKGIDVSNWNGTINWTKVAHAGYRFAIGKATDRRRSTTARTPRTGAAARPPACSSAPTTSPARPGRTSRRPRRAPSRRPITSSVSQLRSRANCRPCSISRRPATSPPAAQGMGGGVGAGGLRPPRRPSSRLLVTRFLAGAPRRLDRGRRRHAALDRALDEREQAVGPRQNWNGLGWTFWQWTDCASVPGIAHCADGDHQERSEPFIARDRAVLAGRTDGLHAAEHRRPARGRHAPLRRAGHLGRRQAARLHVPVAPLRAAARTVSTSRARRRRRTGRQLTTSAIRSRCRHGRHHLRPRNAGAPATVAVSPAGTPPSAHPANIGAPLVLGTLQVGQKLTSTAGAWTGAPTKFTYRWQRCNASGSSALPLEGIAGGVHGDARRPRLDARGHRLGLRPRRLRLRPSL